MALSNVFQLFIIIQFPIICLSHSTHDVILSPNELSGKYVKFNRLIEMSTKAPWEEPLKESAKIALSSSSVSKDSLLKAPYVGVPKVEPSAFGDIVILAKGKLKKHPNETFLFEEIHDVCEYQCQNNADKYLENVTALWMVERIRHRDAERGYRYDLKFTIVPIHNGRNSLVKSNNLEERLRNILKKTFILRDTDYPKYFQQITPKISKRADISRSMAGYLTPNNLMHPAYGYAHPPKMNQLNMGEFYSNINKKSTYVVSKSPALTNYYAPNINHRYPIRFPDSRESLHPIKSSVYRVKLPTKDDEEKQEAHIVNNVVDHRGAVDLSNKHFTQSVPNVLTAQSKPTLPARQTNLYVSQPAILLPQMPISLIHLAPYPIPLQLQVSTPPNQMIYGQSDVTTFRYPTFFNSHHAMPKFQYLQNRTSSFKESERYIPKPAYSHPDPVYHSSTTTERSVFPTMYTPKLSNYVTASSIQVNSYDNNEFQPIIAPYPTQKGTKKNSEEKSLPKLSKYANRHATHKERVKTTVAPPSITTTPYATTTTSAATSDFLRTHSHNHHQQLDYGNYDIVATRPSMTKRTTEKPILKWLPKRHRNKTSSNVIAYTTASTASIEVTSQSSIHPSIKASTPASSSTHAQIFRGRNRFHSNKRNSTGTSTVTKSSEATKLTATTLSSSSHQNLKQFKRKALTTTLLPITTQAPSLLVTNAQATTIFPTFVASSHETKEPIISQSYSTSISLRVDGGEKTLVDTTPAYELIPVGVETIDSNSTNIKIYKASAFSDDGAEHRDNDKEKIENEEIEKTILKHAQLVDDEAKAATKVKQSKSN